MKKVFLFLCFTSQLAHAKPGEFSIVVANTGKDIRTVYRALVVSLQNLQEVLRSENCEMAGTFDTEVEGAEGFFANIAGVLTAPNSAKAEGSILCEDDSTQIHINTKVEGIAQDGPTGSIEVKSSQGRRFYMFEDVNINLPINN